MRSKVQALTLAVAICFTFSAGTSMAQARAPQPSKVKTWQVLPVKQLPMKVVAGHHRHFAHERITKVETATVDGKTFYRLSMRYKGAATQVVFDAQGNELS